MLEITIFWGFPFGISCCPCFLDFPWNQILFSNYCSTITAELQQAFPVTEFGKQNIRDFSRCLWFESLYFSKQGRIKRQTQVRHVRSNVLTTGAAAFTVWDVVRSSAMLALCNSNVFPFFLVVDHCIKLTTQFSFLINTDFFSTLYCCSSCDTTLQNVIIH